MLHNARNTTDILKSNLKILKHIFQGQLAAFGTFNHTWGTNHHCSCMHLTPVKLNKSDKKWMN